MAYRAKGQSRKKNKIIKKSDVFTRTMRGKCEKINTKAYCS